MSDYTRPGKTRLAARSPVFRAKQAEHSGRRAPRGQALIEYVLIVALVTFAIIFILSITGPAIGNVFSNTVYNLLNQTTTPRGTLSDADFWEYATAVASYIPSPFDVKTNTPVADDPNANKPPQCSSQTYLLDTAVTPTLVVSPGFLNVLCSDPNGDILAIVSNTSIPAGKGVMTPANLAGTDGSFTYDPQSFTSGWVAFTFTVSDPSGLNATGVINIGVNVTGEPPKTDTPTPQPSETPVDIAQPYPFYDRGDTPGNWQTTFINVVHGPWDVEYFDNATFSGAPAATGSLYWKPGAETLNEDWGAGVPTGVTITNPDNFSIRYTANDVPFETQRYQIRLTANGAATLKIGGVTVAQIPSDTGSVQTVVADRTMSAGLAQVVLEFAETTGNASVKLVINRLADRGTCGWRISNLSYHSEYNAWQDSVSTNYTVDSTCHLRLRGSIPLPGGTDAKPRLVFWERWALNTNDSLHIGVRDYNAPTADWTWVEVHNSSQANNLNWKRQVFDLRNFGGEDFRGKSIEIAFRVTSIDSNTEDGWYIDDIAVEEDNPTLYTVGFSDDVENDLLSPRYWLNECTWRRTTSQKKSGAYAWTDSPSGNYQNSADCSLQLNGLVDLTAYAGSPTIPELTFWSKADLNTATDMVTVEWAAEGSSTWTALTPLGSTNPWVAKAPTNNTWQQVFISLAGLRGQKFQLRFRLQSDSDGNVADGWYIDDIQLRERVVEILGLPFYEPFTSAERWLLNGTWGLTTGVGAAYYSVPTALHDSPGTGINYVVPSESQAELIPSIDLSASTNPVLTFWTYWEARANLYLDISTDEGTTWEATPLWEKVGNDTDYSNPSRQRAWYRYKLDLSPYQSGTIRLRFRLQANSGPPMDGWYIDDLRIEEDDFTTVSAGGSGFFDNMDGAASANNWLNGGRWQITGEKGIGGSQAWSDSPSGSYQEMSRRVLEFSKAVNLSAAQKPTLYFWNLFERGHANHTLNVDISTDNGFTWQHSTPIWVSPEMVNLGWHRVQVDLTPYKPQGSIRFRFRLEATTTDPVADGWYIDNVSISDRANLTNFGTVFNDEFNDLSRWVVEGNWTPVPDIMSGWNYLPPSLLPVPATYGSLVTSNWVGDYWHIPPTNTEVWGAGGVTWPDAISTPLSPNIALDDTVGEVAFDYSTDLVRRPFSDAVTQWYVPGLANHEYYLMRWQRRYQVLSAGTYLMRLRFAGGARLFINGVLQTPTTTLGKPFQTVGGDPSGDPFRVHSTERSYYFQVSLSGTIDIRVEYFHTTNAASGPGKVEFAVAEPSTVARTSNGTTAAQGYAHLHRTSLILNGLLTIPANRVGNIGYYERWSFTDQDYGKVYYSMDEGFTWTEVTDVRRSNNNPQGGGWSPGSMQDWVNTSFLVTDGGEKFTTEVKIMVKFELDARINTAVDEGWLIDNFQFFVTDAIANTPPVSTSATVATTTNSSVCVLPVVVDNPGDTHTFDVVSGSVLRGSAWGQANQLCYSPPAEWTGVTTFLYKAIDTKGQEVTGTATVAVEPYFYRALNVGANQTQAPSVTIDGNVWNRWNLNASFANHTAGYNSSMTLNPPTDSERETMLRGWREWNGSGNLRAGLSSTENPGVYSMYLYTVEGTSTPTTFSVWQEALDTRSRVITNYSSGSLGDWRRHGPFALQMLDSTASLFFEGNARVAGLEMWRGADYTEWTSADIGGTGVTPGQTLGGGDSLVIRGSGADIWNTYDEFRYVYKVEVGDVEIIARVRWNSWPPDDWSKVGVMIRDTDFRDSRHAMVIIKRGSGVSFQYRSSTGGSSSHQTDTSIDATGHVWLRLVKSGNSFTAYYALTAGKPTAGQWIQRGSSQSITVGSQYLIGIALTSHQNGSLAEATVDNIEIIQR